MRRRAAQLTTILGLSLASAGLVGVSTAAANDADGQADPQQAVLSDAVISPGRLILDSMIPTGERFDPNTDLDPVDRPPSLRPTRASSLDVDDEIRLCFDQPTPAEVKDAAQRAAQIWTNALDIDGPIVEVDVQWLPFRSGTSLGAAGPSSFVIHPDLPRPTMRYPVALANDLLDIDFATRDACDPGRDGEVLLYINSTAGGGSLWHFGEGAPPAGQVDLTSVMVHEIAHGLGFTGSAELTQAGQVAWPDDGGAPYVFDHGVSSCARPASTECTAADLDPLPVGTLGPLVGGDLWYDTGGSPIELHAPSPWDTGSSFSHFAEDSYPESSGLSLMTPFFELGEQHDRVDGATLGVLQRLGWTAATGPATTSMVDVEPITDGVRVTFTSSDLTAGPPPTAHIVRIERQVERDGQFEYELAFEPLEIDQGSITIGGLDSGSSYRLTVQGKNENGLGPIVVSAVFTPGSSSASTESLDIARSVYTRLRERPGTADEVAALAEAIDRDGAGIAVAAVLDEPEFADHHAIVRLYLGFLDRVPETAGVEFWIDQRRDGQDLTTVATRFADASSFELGTTLSAQAFVERVYATILGRPAELEGLVFWVGRLNDGMPRGRLLLEVSESVEHRAANGARSRVIAAYVQLIDRVPTTAELDAGVALIDGGQTSVLISQLLAS